jgi:cytochrome c-type biogenesis protein CcmH/NrfG
MKNQPAKNASGWTNVQVYTAIVVVLVVGALAGYLLHSSGTPAESSAPAMTSTATMPPSQMMPSPGQMLSTQAQPLLDRLQSNPKDVGAMIELGNMYYDAGQWNDAIGFYTRALKETPANPDVRTDMGIAYFNTGNADQALKEFDHALKDDPKHVQTLFNVGVVKMTGKNDPKGAIAAWESLLKIDPEYKERAKVETLMAQAKAKVQ